MSISVQISMTRAEAFLVVGNASIIGADLQMEGLEAVVWLAAAPQRAM
jgi:hypothetical protein